ncbi:hypothetical protein ABTN64_19420, partial [Acinetobacter baumannii]
SQMLSRIHRPAKSFLVLQCENYNSLLTYPTSHATDMIMNALHSAVDIRMYLHIYSNSQDASATLGFFAG